MCCYLLEQLRVAQIGRAFVILGPGKWDIPGYLGDGSQLGVRLGYLIAEDSPDTATTVDQARPFVRDALVAFGFPDVVVEPVDVFPRLMVRQAQTAAALVLGLFPVDQPRKMDMVDRDGGGRVRRIVIKPERTKLCYAWISAVWTPAFTDFLGDFQRQRGGRQASATTPEVHIGEVIDASIDAGLHVDSVAFTEGRYIDIGTPDDLARAVRMFGELHA